MLNRFMQNRVAMQDADNPPAGGDKPSPDAGAAELAKAKKANEALAKKVKASADADAKREEEAAAAKKTKDLDDGKAKELLTAAEKDLEEERAKGAALLATITARTDAQIGALPDDVKTGLAAYKDRVSADVWAMMVDDAAAKHGGNGIAPPAPRAPGRSPDPNDERKIIGSEAQEFLDAHTYSNRAESVVDLTNSFVERHDVPAAEGGAVSSKFVYPVRKQLKMRGASRRPVLFLDNRD
ncbi:MAG TPA: hypothetical protein ENH33_07230 [Actinobacteria bacterium]|nr:hypothetical protein [Actinomycetota bacterium]